MSTLYGKISDGAQTYSSFDNNNNYFKKSSEFLRSNSIASKIVFLITIIFLFVILLRLGISIMSFLFAFSSDPILIDGMVNGDELIIKKQNPNLSNAIPIIRSSDERDGLEFTWSTWVWIKNPSGNSAAYNPTMYHHVFSKGNDNIDSTGIVKPSNAPGLYISPDYRELVVVMNTFDNMREKIIIGNIPIQKWVNVIIRANQRQLDVFINGTMTRSKRLTSIPRQNYDNVYVGLNGGFSGNVSSLRYFSRAIGTLEIQDLINKGPNLTPISDSYIKSIPYYLSFRWFFPQQINV